MLGPFRGKLIEILLPVRAPTIVRPAGVTRGGGAVMGMGGWQEEEEEGWGVKVQLESAGEGNGQEMKL